MSPGGEGHAIVSDYDYEAENGSGSGRDTDRGASFRRIFYRSADSVRVRSGDWGAVSGKSAIVINVNCLTILAIDHGVRFNPYRRKVFILWRDSQV